MFTFLDINRAFGRFYSGPRTDVYLFMGALDEGMGYLTSFDPEAGTVTCEVC